MHRLLTSLFPPGFPENRRLERVALLMSLVSVLCLLALAEARGTWTAVAGDEATFLAMIESLAIDGDLRFSEPDLERLDSAQPGRRAVILQRVGDRISFSKPVVFTLAAAPLFKLFGRWGVVLLNVLVLGGALWLFWRSVRDRPDRGRWALTIATFAGAGALLPQLAWAMGDTLQVALALAGATLVLDRRPGARLWPVPVVGGALLGVLIVMRLPNAVLVAAVLGATWLAGRRRSTHLGAAGVLAGVLLALLLNVALIGSASPYRAERATFNRATGYPAGPGGEEALEQFVAGRATQTLSTLPMLAPRNSAYSALYFLIGRHTGLLLYFPAGLLLFGAALSRGDPASRTLLLGVAALALFYLVWMPQNYFGGASFVGNRYFLPAYALLPLALRRPPRVGSLIAVWTLACLVFVAAWSSVLAERDREFSSQSHAFGGLFRWFPYESTALAIEDREDRYFSDEFVRFVDRNARVSEVGFHLGHRAPAAELLLATARPSGVLRFLVVADSPRATVTYRDWRGRQVFELEQRPDGARGVLEIVAAPAWRRHPFWWTAETLRAHSLELSLEGSAPAASAQFRYLGPYRLVPKFFSYELLELSLPEVPRVGSGEPILLRVVNRGRRPWSSALDVPVHLSYQLIPEGAPERTAVAGLVGLEDFTDQGQELLLETPIAWPSVAGRYRLELDLVVAGAAWFEEWMGAPLGSRVVEVEAGS